MKRKFVTAIFLSGLSISTFADEVLPKEPYQQGDVAAINQLFAQYIMLLDERDADSISKQVYRPPVLSMYPNGTHKIILTPDDLAKTWKAFLGKPRPDGRKSELGKIETCMLGNNTAISSVIFVVPTDGQSNTAQRGWFYTLQKTDGQWHIVSLAPRDANSGFECVNSK